MSVLPVHVQSLLLDLHLRHGMDRGGCGRVRRSSEEVQSCQGTRNATGILATGTCGIRILRDQEPDEVGCDAYDPRHRLDTTLRYIH